MSPVAFLTRPIRWLQGDLEVQNVGQRRAKFRLRLVHDENHARGL